MPLSNSNFVAVGDCNSSVGPFVPDCVLVVLLAAVFILWRTGMLARLRDGEALAQAVMQLGPLGPLLIIGLITVAIVMSPIPSAPIALASGAIYGHYWGRSTSPSAPRPAR